MRPERRSERWRSALAQEQRDEREPASRMRLEALRNFADETLRDEKLEPGLRELATFVSGWAARTLERHPAGREEALGQLDLGFACFRILLRDGRTEEQAASLDAVARRFIDAALADFRDSGGGS